MFLVTPADDDKPEKPEKREFVCARLDVVAMIRDPLSAQWGKLLQWEDPDGRSHEWAMPMAALQGDGAEVRRELAAGGLEISSAFSMRNALASYLGETKTDLRARGVAKTGWYHCPDGYVFVLPDLAVGESAEVVRFQAENVSRAYAVAGTAEGWRDGVAALCAGNTRCVLALCTGFAAMLLEFSGLESGGINLKGSSSTGKTTALAAAASLFGAPSYINRWRATSNGLESLAVLHNDTLLILDELAQVDPKEAGEIAYMLANGQGKQRSARTGSAKPRQSWQLLFLSAGEIGLAQHMADGGKKAKAGQEVRLVDVQADAAQGLGLFDTLHGYANGAALSTAIKAGAAAHHGHAVLAFASVLSKDASELPAMVKHEISLFVQACLPPGETGGQVHRVCERFALLAVAGELASVNDITGWRAGEAVDAIKRCFAEWLSARGSTTNAEPGAMIEAVRSFISKHEEARFTDLDVGQGGLYRACINRAGWRRKAVTGQEYLIDPGIFQGEVCAGFDVPAVCKVLVAAGHLESNVETGKVRYSIKRRINGSGARRVYVVRSSILEA
ncbi:putative inner membrane protein [Polaromonas sp. CG9_12]|nr:putative inner membrane protein [Polaromonas sp. CG9_12]